jgi:protein-disulfide isomerase
MDSSNRLFTVVLISLAAVAGSLGIVFSMGTAVQSATVPLTGYLREISDNQKKLEVLLAKTQQVDLSAIQTRLAVLEARVGDLINQPRAGAQQMPRVQQMPPAEDPNKVYDVPVAGSAVLGPKDAPVTIAIFTDYQCPYCARFYPAALAGQKAFPDKVRIVIKHYPLSFHDKARPAAKAVLAAGEQNKFYEMSDLVFLNAAQLSDDKFKELAGKAGLNVDKFLKDLKNKDADYEKTIQADIELAGKVEVRGTPTYFLNGKKANARSPEEWKAEIAALLKK